MECGVAVVAMPWHTFIMFYSPYPWCRKVFSENLYNIGKTLIIEWWYPWIKIPVNNSFSWRKLTVIWCTDIVNLCVRGLSVKRHLFPIKFYVKLKILRLTLIFSRLLWVILLFQPWTAANVPFSVEVNIPVAVNNKKILVLF